MGNRHSTADPTRLGLSDTNKGLALPKLRVGWTTREWHFPTDERIGLYMKKKVASKVSKPVRNAGTPRLRRVESILVPVDFSDCSIKALSYAVPMAKLLGAKIALLHVVEPLATPDFVGAFPLSMDNDRAAAEARKSLATTSKKLRIPPALIERASVRFGTAYHEIAEAARDLKSDLVILSTHGHTGIKHAFLGSTA